MPFEFSIVHTPGRTLEMTDYLSRHPSEHEGAVAKAEEIFNDWFTINVVDDISLKLPRLADQRKPIKNQNTRKRESEKNERMRRVDSS